ncbi:MAG: hypothetical protein COA79_03925 [Planctomycetota bacterium]|nr:MAG: hypothetical protein COA79_03925 [Planctomycetota bacterium]
MYSLKNIENELSNRSKSEKSANRLLVDYYRIRRRVLFDLPVKELHKIDFSIRGFDAEYPWAIWFIWRLEKRFETLAYDSVINSDIESKEILHKELEAFADWKSYRQYFTKGDLCSGHCGRMLFHAYYDWGLDAPLLNKIKDGCNKLIETSLPILEKQFGFIETADSILENEEKFHSLHNIGFINCVGMLLCLDVVGHEMKSIWLNRVSAMVEALYGLNEKTGFCEGVAYDGYLFDFILEAFRILPKSDRSEFLSHAFIKNLINQNIFLSAPGDLGRVAEIGDVESDNMKYHISCMVKFAGQLNDSQLNWYIKNMAMNQFSSESLGLIYQNNLLKKSSVEPIDCVMRLPATLTLRSDWSDDGIAVATSACLSSAGHIQKDAGTILIGAKEKWLIDDPGYQQYMGTSEREFTLSETAHNFPVINNEGQASKSVEIIDVCNLDKKVELDLTNCYSEELKLKSVTRKIMIVDQSSVVVVDRVLGDAVNSVKYHWHGHPDAGWFVENGWAVVGFEDSNLWFRCLNSNVESKNIHRLKGSRGLQTLIHELKKPVENIIWLFSKDENSIKNIPVVEKNILKWGSLEIDCN